MSASEVSYTNVIHESTVDGGWSGQLRTAVATGINGDKLVFVDSDLLGQRRLVLTAQQAIAEGEALLAAAAEVIPPYPWDLSAFESTYKHPCPPEHARTLADLRRHSRALSDEHEAEKAAMRALLDHLLEQHETNPPWWASAPNPPCSPWCEFDHPDDDFQGGGGMTCRRTIAVTQGMEVEIAQYHGVREAEDDEIHTDPTQIYVDAAPLSDDYLSPDEVEGLLPGLVAALKQAIKEARA